jgi:hypothetical protein
MEKNNWPLVGNRQIADFLEKSSATGHLNGTYIFLGPRQLGKTAAAIFFAQTLLCLERKDKAFSWPCGRCPSCRQFARQKNSDNLEAAHGDFHILKKNPAKKNISIDEVREFIRLLSLSSYFGSYKIGLIKGADGLSIEAANALLKTLEEPRLKVIIILTVSRLEALPATIVSRSQVLRFAPVKFSEIYDYLIKERACQRGLAKSAARLALGRPALAAKFAEDKDFYERHLETADVFLKFFNQDISVRFKCLGALMEKDDSEEENQELKALNILSVWQGAVRDLLLLSLANRDLIQYEDRRQELEAISRRQATSSWSKALKNIFLAESYVRANVSPRLVLENIAAQI